jgi:tetratricopeptide (TPR) repeat protein
MVCDINETQPKEVGTATLQLTTVLGDTTRAKRMTGARQALASVMTNFDKGQNLPGRIFIMAKAYSVLTWLPDFPTMTTRGELGFTNSPTEPVDLVVAIDSLFTTVVKSNPSCAEEVGTWRRSPHWVALLTQSTKMMEPLSGADSAMMTARVDSAEKLILRAQLLDRESFYTWQLLASIATRRDDIPKAIEYWKKTYDTAGTDSVDVEVKLQALYFMGQLNLGEATTRTGAEATTAARDAANNFRTFLVEAPTHKDVPAARANLATALMAAGDTAAVPEVYADLLANPDKYTSRDHLQSGVAATNANRIDDAVKLFNNSLAATPCDRDALFNLSVSMVNASMFGPLLPYATRLVELDPNNSTNYQMLVWAYAMEEKSEANADRKKLLGDSLTKYNDTYLKIDASHEVSFSVFQREPNATTLSGTITNKSGEARAIKLDVDFLSNTCETIESGSADVGTVQPNEKKEFTIRVERGGIAAFRSKAIPPPPM